MHSQKALVPGTNDKMYATIKCHGCDRFDHYRSHCPEENGQQNLNLEERVENEDKDKETAIGVQKM